MNLDVFSLPMLEELTAHISRRQVGEESPVIVVSHPQVRAAVALQGAHLIAWQPAGEQPVLWLSEATAFKEGVAIRGGVPVCWPWFGPGGVPGHGFARISAFELASYEEDEHEVRLDFTLRSDERTKKLWPHDFVLLLRFRLGQTCDITLEAHGDYESTGALHSYFSVDAIEDVQASGLGIPYIDEVLETTGSQHGALTFPGRTDRVFTAPDSITRIEDAGLQRVIGVRHHNFSDVVAWSPGPELSKSMADLTDEGYKEFVCIETARISKPMTSAPDRPATLAATFVLVR